MQKMVKCHHLVACQNYLLGFSLVCNKIHLPTIKLAETAEMQIYHLYIVCHFALLPRASGFLAHAPLNVNRYTDVNCNM